MRTSTNYGLKLMEGTDNVRRQDFVDNFEIIDRELKNNDSSLKIITNKVDNIKIADGTTSQKGIVQLENSISSTSITKAATPNSVKVAYDKGNEALNKANQAFQYANNGKTSIANVLGYVTGSNTHQQIANELQNAKNILANNINAKGAGAVSGGWGLRDLANRVGNISVASLGGRKCIVGSIFVDSNKKKSFHILTGSKDAYEYEPYAEITGFDFIPKYAMISTNSSDGCVNELSQAFFFDKSVFLTGPSRYPLYFRNDNNAMIMSYGHLLLPLYYGGNYQYIISE